MDCGWPGAESCRTIGDGLSGSVHVQNIVDMEIIVESLVLDGVGCLLDVVQGRLIDAAEDSQTERLDAFREGQVVPACNLLLLVVMMPRVQRQTHDLMIDLGEASFLQAADGVAGAVGQWAHGSLRGFLQVPVPGGEGGRFQGAIIAAGLEVNLDLLEPGPRTEVGECTAIQARPAHDAATTHLHMDDVPGILAHLPQRLVVKGRVEVAILGAVGRLDGSEVDAHDVRIREFVGDVERPDAGPAAQVHDPGVRRVRGIQQTITVPCFGDDLVEDVEAVLLDFVAGKEIGPFSKTLVGAAVDAVPGVRSGTPRGIASQCAEGRQSRPSGKGGESDRRWMTYHT